MTGRGRIAPQLPSDNPQATLGITLSTPTKLDPSSDQPFFITVRARLLSSSRPDKPIVFQTWQTPVEALVNRAFPNLACVAPPDAVKGGKHINIRPKGPPQYHWDPEDLRGTWHFQEVPALGTGVLEVKHQVPLDRIQQANLQTGELYRVTVAEPRSRCRWFAFKSFAELEGHRLRTWRAAEEDTKPTENTWHKPYPEGPTEMGEDPLDLAIVLEDDGEAEFEIA